MVFRLWRAGALFMVPGMNSNPAAPQVQSPISRPVTCLGLRASCAVKWSALVGILLAMPHLTSDFVAGQDLEPILLPPPPMEGGQPLMDVLRQRKSTREFRRTRLSPRVLSNLLWAGFGINRPESSHRTAPSAMNAQEIDIYVANQDGLYVYEPREHQLKFVQAGDLRSKTSGQEFAREAPLALIFVADYTRMVKARPDQKDFYAAIDTGCISQNIYLFCASEGLGMSWGIARE